MFLEEKQDGKIKGQTVAVVNKKFTYIPKEDSSSPTVSTESILLTSIVNADKNRDIVVINIPNTFIHTRIQEEKNMEIIKLCGVWVNILCKISPNYNPYVTRDKKGVKNFLVRC